MYEGVVFLCVAHSHPYMRRTIPNHVFNNLIAVYLAGDLNPGYELAIKRIKTDATGNAKVEFSVTKKGKRTTLDKAMSLSTLDDHLFDSLLWFNFPSRVNKALQSAGFHSLWQLAILSETAMHKIQGINKSSVKEIMSRLREIPEFDNQSAILRGRARAYFFPKVLTLGVKMEFQLAKHDEVTENFISTQVGNLVPRYGKKKTATPA